MLLHEIFQNKASYGIDVKHFLYEWSSHEVVEEHAQLKAKLEKKKQLREAKMQQAHGELGEPASKRRRGDGGSLLNSGMRKSSNQGKTQRRL